MRILIVEDDQSIVRMLERGLSAHGYQCVSAEDGELGVSLAVDDDTVGLVLLDLWLPKLDGHQVLRRIRRERPDLPVLMLTARDDVHNKVSALDGGADDYLTKPFVFEELLARIRALTRRLDQPTSSMLEVGDLKLDLPARRAWVGERQMDLSSREFDILEYFMRHAGQVLSRQQILSSTWDQGFDPGSNVVDVYVRYLRKKLSPRGEDSRITTVRGAGYRLEKPGNPGPPGR